MRIDELDANTTAIFSFICLVACVLGIFALTLDERNHQHHMADFKVDRVNEVAVNVQSLRVNVEELRQDQRWMVTKILNPDWDPECVEYIYPYRVEIPVRAVGCGE